MSSRAEPKGTAIALGIECGGTRTVALAADASGRQLHRAEFGPANLRLLDDQKLATHFKAIAARMPAPSAIGLGMAGARSRQNRKPSRPGASRCLGGIASISAHQREQRLRTSPAY